ncbi:MAG: MotA/TolQ/ExbB proton channel family protein [Candidatus Cloacimonetes bacterium]|nr:MotA/TolQ/ExbB proton channel family protein [Candidatus Cloacimonadota bacterium]
MWNVVYQFIQNGGLFMHVISFWLVVALYVVLGRVYHLWFGKSGKLVHVLNELKPDVNTINQCHEWINETVSKTPSSENPEQLAWNIKYKESIIAEKEWRFRNRLALYQAKAIHQVEWLFQVANLATLTGLLGTVFGLIKAFSALSEAVPAQKNIIMATGISNAMNTTAYGLMVALPCLFFYQLLLDVVESRIEVLDNEIRSSELEKKNDKEV